MKVIFNEPIGRGMWLLLLMLFATTAFSQSTRESRILALMDEIRSSTRQSGYRFHQYTSGDVMWEKPLCFWIEGKHHRDCDIRLPKDGSIEFMTKIGRLKVMDISDKTKYVGHIDGMFMVLTKPYMFSEKWVGAFYDAKGGIKIFWVVSESE